MLTKSIYKIENLMNGKVYIGQSIHPQRRLVEHLYHAKHNIDTLPIHEALSEYNKEVFSFEILEENIENYNEREEYWIKYYNSIVPNGYNILPGGQTNPVLKGEQHPRNTLSNQQVEEIVDMLLLSNKTQREIAQYIGTTERVINSINKGETHRIEGYEYPLRNKFCHFSQKTLNEIMWLLENTDASLESIAQYYNLTKGNISQINLGKIHKINREYPIRLGTGRPREAMEIVTMLFKKENVPSINYWSYLEEEEIDVNKGNN